MPPDEMVAAKDENKCRNDPQSNLGKNRKSENGGGGGYGGGGGGGGETCEKPPPARQEQELRRGLD